MLRMTESNGDYWFNQDDWQQLIKIYENGLEINPFKEIFYRRLMQCHEHMGSLSEALATYERCCEVMSTSLNTLPGKDTVNLYFIFVAVQR